MNYFVIVLKILGVGMFVKAITLLSKSGGYIPPPAENSVYGWVSKFCQKF